MPSANDLGGSNAGAVAAGPIHSAFFSSPRRSFDHGHARQGASGGSLAWHRYLGTRAFTCTLRIRYLLHTRAHGVCVRMHARVRGLRLCVRAPATQPKAPHKRRCQRIGGREGRTGAQRLEAGVVGARGVGVEVDAGDWVEDAAARPSRDHRRSTVLLALDGGGTLASVRRHLGKARWARVAAPRTIGKPCTRAPMAAGASGAWLLMSWCTSCVHCAHCTRRMLISSTPRACVREPLWVWSSVLVRVWVVPCEARGAEP